MSEQTRRDGVPEEDQAGKAGGESLQKILTNTIDTIETNKQQIFQIYETAHNEVDAARKQLAELRQEIARTIDRVDALAKLEQQEKQELVRVSKNFGEYTEDQVREVYQRVSKVQIDLSTEREREHQMRDARDNLERRLRSMNALLRKSEHLAMAVGSVLSYLSTQVNGVIWKIEAVQQKQFVGARVIKAQEDERYRISRELHDGPAQGLANLSFQASYVDRLMDRDLLKAHEEIKVLRDEVKEILRETRGVIFDMRPIELDDIGLAAAISQLGAKLESRGRLKVQFGLEGNEYELPKHVTIAIFRIVQEALTNVVHHAETDTARVRMLYSPQALSVLVEDNGVGFDPDVDPNAAEEAAGEEDPMVEPRGHFGMLGMGERAKIIGAELAVTSAPGKGTRVHLRIPLRHPEAYDEAKARNLAKAAKEAKEKTEQLNRES